MLKFNIHGVAKLRRCVVAVLFVVVAVAIMEIGDDFTSGVGG